MNFTTKLLLCSLLSFSYISCGKTQASEAESENNTNVTEQAMAENDSNNLTVEIQTSLGDITVVLYGDTPIHQKNFLKLVKEGYYDGVLFHRVINEFMVQTGDPNSKNAPAGKMLGEGDPGYTLEAEFVYPRHFHKRGALAAARTGDQINPERRSSGSQFYIVTGKAFNEKQLAQMEKQMRQMQQQAIFDSLAREHKDTLMALRRNRDQAGLQKLQEELVAITTQEAAKNPAKFTDEQRTAYSTVGGTPHLDGQYTVFGEVVKGMDVVEKIEKAETLPGDRPKEDIKIIKMSVVND